jgi:hypothetical protein
MDDDDSIFGPMWPQIHAEIERDLANEPSPSDETE